MQNDAIFFFRLIVAVGDECRLGHPQTKLPFRRGFALTDRKNADRERFGRSGEDGFILNVPERFVAEAHSKITVLPTGGEQTDAFQRVTQPRVVLFRGQPFRWDGPDRGEIRRDLDPGWKRPIQ